MKYNEDMKMEKEIIVSEASKTLKNLSFAAVIGSRSKKRLSNKVSLTKSLDGGSVSIDLTVREAQALRRFLNDSLE